MILAIDIGNTRTKIAIFEKDTLQDVLYIELKKLEKTIENIFKKKSVKPKIILSSVGKLQAETILWLQQNTEVIEITHQSNFPFTNLYATPTTLGIDRMVLAAGAVLQFPNSNRLVIDAGTCITYEFITDKDEYLGGAISPGLLLRYKALNHYTAKLPLLAPEDIDYLIGDQTDRSIHSGVINGITQEIEGIVSLYKQRYPDLKIILTGGDTLFLVKRLKNVIFANSNFLLESLNNLYQYTIENDKKIFFSLSLLCGTAALAQQGNASPYSYYGIGTVNYNGTNEYKAMGGTNVYADSIHINLKNPASFAKLKRTTFSLGATATSYSFKNDMNSDKANRQTIDYVVVGLPIAKNFGVVFGLLPFSNVGYKINGEGTNSQGQKINSKYEGNGGINKAFLGAGYEINSNFSVGANAGYYFGNTKNDIYSNITDLGDGTSLQNITREYRKLNYSGFSFDLSAQYFGKFKDYDVQANVTYSPETKWTNENFTQQQILNVTQIVDQKVIIDASKKITNPQALSMGLGFGKNLKWFVGGQYTFTQNSKLSDSWNNTTIANYENSNRFSVGGFYIPKYNSFSSYFDRIVYRAGFKYENTGLVLNDKSINDMAVNAGFGFPIGDPRKFTNLNIGVEYGSRGTKNNGLTKENYFSVYVGFSLNDLWFQKRRFD